MRSSSLAVLFALLFVWPESRLRAEEPPSRDDLTRLGVEELMGTEVSLVSKREQLFWRTPAAVYVLTREEIRRSGASTVAELLRMVPGFHVARIDANKWAVSARGFNGRYSDKLLVMVDGRTVYSPLFSGVYWELLDTMTEDIERIEVIRGPGATMWGANAVNGVVNILTRKASETQGGYVSVRSGNQDLAVAGLRSGGRIGNRGHWRGHSKFAKRNHSTLAEGAERGLPSGDEWTSARSGFRTDFALGSGESFTFSGDLGEIRPRSRLNLPAEPPMFTRSVDDRSRLSTGFVLGRWDREDKFKGTATSVQAFYDRTHRRTALIEDRRNTLDFELQHGRRLGDRHELLTGTGFRVSISDTKGTVFARVSPPGRTDPLWNTFLEDRIAVIPERLEVSLGTKLEHNNYTGFEIQPGARVLWTPGRRYSVWAAVSRAVSTPSQSDHDAQAYSSTFPDASGLPVRLTFSGNRGLLPETVIAVEAGYRWQVARGFTLDLAVYRNAYERLSAAEQLTPRLHLPAPGQPYTYIEVPLQLKNGVYGKTWGGESALTWTVRPWWKLSGSYSRLAMDLAARPWSNSSDYLRYKAENPENQAQVRSYFDLPRGVELDLSYYAASSQGDALRSRQFSRTPIGQYQRLDARFGWRAGGFEFSVGGENILDPRHPEYTSEEPWANPTEIGRSIYVRLGRRF